MAINVSLLDLQIIAASPQIKFGYKCVNECNVKFAFLPERAETNISHAQISINESSLFIISLQRCSHCH